eukprot:7362194-Prymnesium_polylepis.1
MAAALAVLKSSAAAWLHREQKLGLDAWAVWWRARRRAWRTLRRAAMALLARDVRQAMNSWQAEAAARRAAIKRLRHMTSHWQRLAVSRRFRQWRESTKPANKKKGDKPPARTPPTARPLPLAPPPARLHQLRRHAVWKRGRYSFLWRRVALEFEGTELVYTYGGGERQPPEPWRKRRSIPL